MRTILCFGDSNTWGFDPLTGTRFPREVRWTGRLQALLGGEFWVVEEGLNARTACFDDPIFPGRNGLANVELCLLSAMPIDLVVVMLGTNDAKRHLAGTPHAVARGIELIVERVRAGDYGPAGRPPRILIVSPVRIGRNVAQRWTGSEFDLAGADLVDELAQHLRRLADRQGCHFLDAAEVSEADPSDAIHLNGENHQKLAAAVHEAISAILGPDDEPPRTESPARKDVL